MAWFGDSLSTFSSLKGQIANFTKDVLSEGIVEEVDERAKALKEANERCSQLEDLLIAKDAEISLLRRQNYELQTAVVEINAKPKEPRDTNHNDEATEGVFWDPSCDNNRNARNQNHVRQLQEQLAQATVKVRELECELKRVEMVNNTSLLFPDDIPDGHRRAEVLRAKQDMLNRIIQIEEKTREAERNAKRIQLDEATLVSDFRSIISKLNSHEKFDLVSGALKALQIESETHGKMNDQHEKSDSDEKLGRAGGFEYNPLTLKHHFDANSEPDKPSDTNDEHSTNREDTLRKRIEELENKNKDLLEAMEKLDEEHAQSIEELLSLRQEANKKHRSLQSAYERLSADHKAAQREMIELRGDDTQSRRLDKSTDKLDKHVQATLPAERDDDSRSEASVLDDIAEKVQAILRRCAISSAEPGESIFETVARRYVDAEWKLDVLERKVTESARSLKDAEDLKEGLQMDCEELQSHVDSLLMENRTLKSCLPSIPEASEERVASLEMAVEALNEEVKSLSEENEMLREKTGAAEPRESFPTSYGQSREDQSRIVSREVVHSGHLEQIKESPEEEFDSSKDTAERDECAAPSAEDEGSREDAAAPTDLDRETATRNSALAVSEVGSIFRDWREHGSQGEQDSLSSDLQRRLDGADRDLQAGMPRNERESNEMRAQIDARECRLAKLCQDNDRLEKSNASLQEQLAAAHDESLGKIELLNTEMSLLQQEHEDLEREVSACREESARAKEDLRATRQQHAELASERGALRARCEQLEAEKKSIRSAVAERATRVRELESELGRRESLAEELNLLRDKCQFLEREREEALGSSTGLPRTVAPVDSSQTDNEVGAVGDDSDEAGNATEGLARAEQRHSTTEAANNVAFERSQQLRTLERIIDEERREKDIARQRNERLSHEIAELRGGLQTAAEDNKESAEMAKRTIEDLSRLIRDRDEEVSVLRSDVAQANDTVAKLLNEMPTIARRRDELERLVALQHNEILSHREEIERLMRRANEQAAHIQGLTSERATKEAEGKTEESNRSLMEGRIAELEAALIERQSNDRMLRDQLAESQGKESNAAKELERLRTHLVEMESTYTEEALIFEKNREQLEAKLLQAEEKVKNSTTAYTSASIRANQQVETLQQQIALIIQQRDQIQAKLSATEDNVLMQSASLTNLQIVLEQFQQTKERDIMSATAKIRSQLSESCEKQKELACEISTLKQQLSEAKECLQAASRLSEQLEKKDEEIERLGEEATRLTTLVNSTNQKVQETMERDEGKVDKTLVKNLLLGYLSSTTSDKSSILRVFATVLDFNESEKEKTGLNNATTQGNWLVRGGKSGGALLKDEETSLTTAFVRFLENESKPKPQLPALPIVNSPSPRPGNNKQQSSLTGTLSSSSSASTSLSSSSSSSSSSLSTQSTLLLSNVALPTFPDFVPARNTGSILKEVLKDS